MWADGKFAASFHSVPAAATTRACLFGDSKCRHNFNFYLHDKKVKRNLPLDRK